MLHRHCFVKQAFRKLDADGDGTLTSLEFKRGLRKLGIGEYLAEKDVRRCVLRYWARTHDELQTAAFCEQHKLIPTELGLDGA